MLLTFINSLPINEREAFAKRCGTSLGYLKQVAYKERKCPAWLAIALERESNRILRCEQLCPDPKVDWAYLRATNNADRRRAERRAGG